MQWWHGHRLANDGRHDKPDRHHAQLVSCTASWVIPTDCQVELCPVIRMKHVNSGMVMRHCTLMGAGLQGQIPFFDVRRTA